MVESSRSRSACGSGSGAGNAGPGRPPYGRPGSGVRRGAPAHTGMGTDTNRVPDSFSTTTSLTLDGSTAAEPSSEAPLPSPF